MKSKVLWRIFGFISLLLLIYCLFSYVFIQSKLTMGLTEIPAMAKTLGNIVLPALLIVGVYHLFLLVNILKTQNGSFVNSLYIVLIILSGITLLSDLTLLSDISKEYLFWDVNSEWILLYMFTAFHILVNIWGLIYSYRNSDANNKLFQPANNCNDTLFLSINNIALISGIAGIFGVVFAALELFTPQKYVPQFMVLLAGLALLPLILFAIYWFIKLAKKPLVEWLDEKQVLDTAFGALFSSVIAIPLYIIACFAGLTKLVNFQISFWILSIFFMQLTAFSSVVITRNR